MKSFHKSYFKRTFILFIISLVFIGAFETHYGLVKASNGEQYDLVIKGGTIINPSTEHILKGYSLGITDGKITRITTEDISGEELIDATGLVAVPGFIDLISYEPNHVGIPLKIQDGVTSNLLMHGGTENAKIWYDNWIKKGQPVNFGASSFITRMRWPIIGSNIDSSITKEDDIKKLTDAVRKNIEEGALGVSFSFEYIPGIKGDEVIALLHLAHEYNAPTFYHTRYSSAEPPEHGPAGIEEVLDYARETGAAVHIMHINSTGGTHYMEEALGMLEAARGEGIDATACVYVYDGWATYLSSARFRPGWQERFRITYNDLQITATDERVTEGTFPKYRQQGKLAYAHNSMPEEELIMALHDPYVMIGSDTITSPSLNNHPRGAGNYARLFGRYVREEKVLTMMEAVKKTSLLPAQRLEDIAPSMKKRGRIELGCFADITIFNPDTIIDRSTPENPGLPSAGVEYVIVNGITVKDPEGVIKGVNPGKPVYSYFVDDGGQIQTAVYDMIVDNEATVKLEGVYELDGKVYLPIDVFDLIGIKVKGSEEGTIVIDDAVTFKVGSDRAYGEGVPGEEEGMLQLAFEPIIYDGNLCIELSAFGDMVAYKFESSFSDDLMEFKTKEIVPAHPKALENVKDARGSLFIILIIAVLGAGIFVYSKTNKNKQQ